MTERETLDHAASLTGSGRVREAAETLAGASAVFPGSADILNHLGAALFSLGNFQGAAAAWRKAAGLEPARDALHANLSMALSAAGEKNAALESCLTALSLSPENPAFLSSAAELCSQTGDFAKAGEFHRTLCRLCPDDPRVWHNLGVLLSSENRTPEAADCYRKALQADPDYQGSLINLGNALTFQREYGEAEGLLKRALALNPGSWEARANLSLVFMETGKFDEALSAAAEAAEMRPGDHKMLFNLGNVLRQRRDFDGAVSAYEAALRIRPDFFEAEVIIGMALLSIGNFKDGWRRYEARLRLRDAGRNDLPGRRVWDGSRMDGKTLLAHVEQGAGDTIQFSRLLPAVKEQSGASVIFVCQDYLWPLLKNCPGADCVIPVSEFDDKTAVFDAHIHLMSIPDRIGLTPENIPFRDKYIGAPADKAEFWRARVSALKGKKIGLSWRGAAANPNDKMRSIDFGTLRPLFELDGVSFVSLQKLGAPRPGEADGLRNFYDWSPEFSDFSDTAGLLSHLDMVVSVDTSVTHLSGAMGVKTWTLLPFTPEWRWMYDRTDSPWYSSMRLIRQRSFNRWDTVIREVRRDIKELVSRSC